MGRVGAKGKGGPAADDDRRGSRLDDLELARGARRDREAAGRLLDRLAPAVTRVVRMLAGSDDEVDDMVSLCMTRILEHGHKYRAEGSLEAWARGLACRVVLRQEKRRRRYERTVVLSPDEKGLDASDPEKETGRRMAARRIERHLRSIPLERRATLLLRVVYGHSVAETADITGVPVNTARNRIRVALRELRESLSGDPVIRELVPGKADDERR